MSSTTTQQQGCFEAEAYHSYITGLTALGCRVPIVPGILMFKTKASFVTMARLCDVKVPSSWTLALDGKEAKDALITGQNLVLLSYHIICYEMIVNNTM
jgi:5,10-methylenetetrahydrofolate reductase